MMNTESVKKCLTLEGKQIYPMNIINDVHPTILLVDDSEMNLSLLEELIKINFRDARVFKATDGETGVRLAATHHPDVVLLDIKMPLVDGFQVCSQLRSNELTEGIPVVFLTAYDEAGYRIKALEAGASGFMTKPVDESELVAQIKTMQKLKAVMKHEKEEKHKLELLVAERTAALEKELAERRKAERILHESEEKFAVAFRTSSFMMAIFSLENGRFVEINESFQKILGYTISDLQDGEHPGLAICDEPAQYNAMIHDLQNGRRIEAKEMYLKTAGGNRVACSLSASTLKLQNSLFVLISIEDITERKKQERLLSDNEMQMRTLAENLPGFFYQLQVFSKDDIRVNHISKGVDRFGITAEEVLENPFCFFNIIRPEDFERLLKQNDDEVLKKNQYHEQFQVTTPDGRSKWIEVHDVPREEQDGSYIYNGYAFDITQRKAAQKKQAQSEEQFQKLIESLPVSVAIISLEGKVLYLNPQCKELFEIPEDFEYSLGTAFMYWVNPDDRMKWIKEIKDQGEVKNMLLHVKSFKGKEIWAYGSGLFVQYKNETCVLSTHQDITQVKKAQDDLRESEEKFSKAFKMSPYAITVSRMSDGKIIDVNDAFTLISGYTREEAIKDSAIYLKLWKNLDDRLKVVELLQQGKNVIGHEFEFRNKKGNTIIGSTSMQILTIGGEQCLVGSIEDITQRKRKERELQQSRRNFYSAFVSSPVALAISTISTGELKMVNDSYCNIMEYTEEQVIGKTVFDLNIYPEPSERNYLLDQMKSRKTARNFELPVTTGKGNRRILLASMEPIIYNDEDCIIATFIDITDRKMAEAALKNNYAILQMAATTARFGGWNVDPTADVCYWSDVVAEIHEMPFGYSPKVSEGISFYAPEHRQTITEAFTKCAQQGTGYDLELQIITSSKRKVWVRTIGQAVKDDNGKIVNIIGSFQDIDEQKKMVAALKESEQKFKSLADNAMVIISIISMEGKTRYLYVNKEWEKVTGYSSADLETVTPIGMAHPDLRDSILKNARNRMENKPAPNRYDTRIIAKNGDIVELDFSAVPIIYDNQPAILSAAIDITDRKRTEQELKERMDELERFHQLTVDRELNMIELKKEVNALLAKSGDKPKYRIVE
jgi:PAS domain S-box-containing protein